MQSMKSLLVFASTLALPSVALAHPGHGGTAADTLTHYAIEPEHGLVLGLFSLGLAAAGALAYRARSPRA